MEKLNNTYSKIMEILTPYKNILGQDEEINRVFSFYVGRDLIEGIEINEPELDEFKRFVDQKLKSSCKIN